MSDNLQEIIDRVKTGSYSSEDICDIAAAIHSGRLVLSSASPFVGVGGDAKEARIITGNQNVTGDRNVVIHIDEASIQAIKAIPSLQILLSQTSNLMTSEREVSVEQLVKEVREKIKADIQKRCGEMRVLDMTQPIGLSDIYTDVNILEKISGRRWLNISELMQNFDPESESFDRYGLCGVSEKRVLGIDAVKQHPRLMVLGKPGAGKTTFLKYLAIQCIVGNFQTNRIPIFVNLKQFSENPQNLDMLGFIAKFFMEFEIPSDYIIYLLKSGSFLFLFDGLDEVSEEESEKTINQVRDFSESFFFSNNFDERLNSFLDELVSEFKLISWSSKKDKSKYIDWLTKQFSTKSSLLNKIQISYEELARKISKGVINVNEKQEHEKLVREFSSKLNEISRNEYLQYFSSQNCNETYSNNFIITCRIAAREEKFEQFTEVEVADFDDNQIKTFVGKWFESTMNDSAKAFISRLESTNRIKELASNPLLLTLLCLVFQDIFDFPSNRGELYKEGVSILLKKWDAERLIKRERNEIYQKLSSSRKEDLLSYIAFTGFERKEYFFKQVHLEKYISDYIQNLPNAQLDSTSLQIDSEAVLKSIEAQHGLLVERARCIYSFSHLTFQEYFTARKIITTTSPQLLENGLHILATHINDRRWREVLLLAVGMLSDANRLLQLLKRQTDLILSQSEYLQEFLSWLQEKSLEFDSPYQKICLRAFYLTHIYNLCCDDRSNRVIDDQLTCAFDPSLNRQIVAKSHKVHQNLYEAQCRAAPHRNSPEFVLTIISTPPEVFDLLFSSEVSEKLKLLQARIPLKIQKNEFENWWVTNSRVWTLELKKILQNLDFGRKWSFDNHQMILLEEYHNANLLILECLKGDCYISRDIRKYLEETFLLPITEIDEYKLEKQIE